MKRYLLIAIPILVVVLFTTLFLTRSDEIVNQPQPIKLGAGKPFDRDWLSKTLPDMGQRIAFQQLLKEKSHLIGRIEIVDGGELAVEKAVYEAFRRLNSVLTPEEKSKTIKQLTTESKERAGQVSEELLGVGEDGSPTIGEIVETIDDLDLTFVQ